MKIQHLFAMIQGIIKMTNKLSNLKNSLLGLTLAISLTGCNEYSKNLNEYKEKVHEQQKLQAEKIQLHNKAKQEWKSQKLEGKVIEFQNIDGSKNRKFPLSGFVLYQDACSIYWDFKEKGSLTIYENRTFRFQESSIKVVKDIKEDKERYAEITNLQLSNWDNSYHYNEFMIHIKPEDEIKQSNMYLKRPTYKK